MADDSADVVISPKGITLRGAYEDVRPLIKRGVAIADGMLQVMENAVGLPTDFLNHHLGRFRESYRAKLESIPVESRQTPPFRIGCGVLKEVAYAADEPDLQDMFAELLGAASDQRTADDVHPGFASIINQLTSLDAKILRRLTTLAEGWLKPQLNLYRLKQGQQSFSEGDLRVSVDNLVRLGLAEWSVKGVTSSDVSSFRFNVRRIGSSSSLYSQLRTTRDIEQKFDDVNKSVEKIADGMERLLANVGDKDEISATSLGFKFVRACMPLTSEPQVSEQTESSEVFPESADIIEPAPK